MTKKEKYKLRWALIGLSVGLFWIYGLINFISFEIVLVDIMFIIFLVVIPLVGGIFNLIQFVKMKDSGNRNEN